MHTYMYAYIHVCIHTCMHKYLYVYIPACIHTCMASPQNATPPYAYIYVCMHTYMHTYMHGVPPPYWVPCKVRRPRLSSPQLSKTWVVRPATLAWQRLNTERDQARASSARAPCNKCQLASTHTHTHTHMLTSRGRRIGAHRVRREVKGLPELPLGVLDQLPSVQMP